MAKARGLSAHFVMPSSNASVGLPRTPGDFFAAAPLVIQYHGRLDIVRPIFEVDDGVQAFTVPMSVFVKLGNARLRGNRDGIRISKE